MLVLGWSILPGGALYWTLATMVFLLLPVLVQLAFNLGRALLKLSVVAARESLSTFTSAFGFTLLNLTFLPHHMLLSLDAIARSLGRRLLSGRRLLEWETAAQSESGGSQTPLDLYLQRSPFVALLIAGVLAVTHVRSLFDAAPILILWSMAPLVVIWLNSPPRREEGPLSAEDTSFLRQQALRVWRYFLEFGDERNHWLIPDNVEEKDTFQVRKLSPTNLGMLFNARQAAYELGFLTLPEFARATLGTLATYERLEKQRGHIYNWYDIKNLRPIGPLTISAVDSGNLAASFYTLHTGALDLLKRPVLSREVVADLQQIVSATDKPTADEKTIDPDWMVSEAARHRSALSDFVENYTPWLLTRYTPLFELPQLGNDDAQQIPDLHAAAEYAADLEHRIARSETALPPLAAELRSQLNDAVPRLAQLKADIATIAAKAESNADAMEYGFLLVESRQLLSIGYDGVTGEVHSACYDLLASEARIASFIAVAKGDIPQQSWFRLDRTHVLADGRPALLSWTGTMFEYMMPALWMRNFPDTLIFRSLESVAHVQRDYVRDIPWGISESGFAKMDPLGRYSYQAWGIPALASKYGAEDGPVISPYSTFLVLPIFRKAAIANLRRMAALGWTGAYGFYEAADYTQGKQAQLVRSWMAHHQGMCLLAVTNLLKDNILQRWFHGTPVVRAAELLLHEKPLSKETLKELSKRSRLNASEADHSDAGKSRPL
jgi:hypothetical protein